MYFKGQNIKNHFVKKVHFKGENLNKSFDFFDKVIKNFFDVAFQLSDFCRSECFPICHLREDFILSSTITQATNDGLKDETFLVLGKTRLVL